MKRYKWTVEFEVDETWVEDGFELTDERAHAMLANALSCAYNTEFSAKVISAPPQAEIRKAQGYEDEKATA